MARLGLGGGGSWLTQRTEQRGGQTGPPAEPWLPGEALARPNQEERASRCKSGPGPGPGCGGRGTWSATGPSGCGTTRRISDIFPPLRLRVPAPAAQHGAPRGDAASRTPHPTHGTWPRDRLAAGGRPGKRSCLLSRSSVRRSVTQDGPTSTPPDPQLTIQQCYTVDQRTIRWCFAIDSPTMGTMESRRQSPGVHARKRGPSVMTGTTGTTSTTRTATACPSAGSSRRW